MHIRQKMSALSPKAKKNLESWECQARKRMATCLIATW